MWAKLGRAEELLKGLDNEVDIWLKAKPYDFAPRLNPEATRLSVIATVNVYPPITEWSLVLSDVLHNLRCTLDHLIWALLVYKYPYGLPAGADRIQFPIWTSAPSASAKKSIDCLGSSVVTAIHGVQPCYNTLGDFPIHALAILQYFDNMNKHKLLKLAMASAAQGKINVTWDEAGDFPTSSLNRGEVQNDTEILTIDFQVPHPEVKYNVGLGLIIAVQYPIATMVGADRDDYSALCWALVAEVRHVIDTVVAAVN
jgi:hypothetical protein